MGNRDDETFEPLRSYRFLVEIEGGDSRVTAAFSQFSGVNMTVETIQARAGRDPRGVQGDVPVQTRYEPVTLAKGVVGDYELLDWLYAAAAGNDTGPTGGESLYRTVRVLALNEDYKGVIWELKDALPIGYSLSEMDGLRSEMLIESLTLAITGVRRELF